MKFKVLSIVLAISVFLCGRAKAENIDVQTAKQIGAYYFTVATGAKAPIEADNLKLIQQFDNPTLCIPALYAFNVAGNGFIIVSASDCVEPVLAYSPVGSFDPDNINPACQYILDSYVRVVSENQNSNAVASAQAKSLWDEMTQQTFTCNPDSKAVLVQAKWDQIEPYNYWSPVKQGVHCPAGCVATAMGMIIHFWKHPEVGGNDNESTASCPWNGTTLRYKFRVDSNKFHYEDMPNQLKTNSTYEQMRAIGKLLLACGITVKMNWDVEGSGAHSEDVPGALSRWFRYSSEAKYILRERAYVNAAGHLSFTTLVSDAEWLSILHSEIDDHARPVYYSGTDYNGTGRDAGGHAFVIAGSSAADQKKFFIRWGWGGSSDGFFTLAPTTSVERSGGYTFNHGHGMVYQIYPNTLGIDDNTTYTEAPCYPNPATDYMMIPADLPLNAYLTIYSADGRMVDNLVIPGGTKEYRLNLQGYAPGVYLYRLNGNAVKFTVQ